MGISLSFDNQNFMIGMGLLGTAIAKRRARKRMTEFQVGTSLFERLTDPNLSAEERSRLKQRLGETLRLDDSSALSDDIGELSGQVQTLFAEQFGDTLGNPAHKSLIDNIVGTAKKNDKINDMYSQLLPALQERNPTMAGVAELIGVTNKEFAVDMMLKGLDQQFEILGQGQSNLEFIKSPEGREALAQKAEDTLLMWDLSGKAIFKEQLGIKAQFSGRGSGGSGGGSGSGFGPTGGYKSINAYLKAANDKHKAGVTLVDGASTELDTLNKLRTDMLNDLSENPNLDLDSAINSPAYTDANINEASFMYIVSTSNNQEQAFELMEAQYGTTPEQFNEAIINMNEKYGFAEQNMVAQFMDIDTRLAATQIELQKGGALISDANRMYSEANGQVGNQAQNDVNLGISTTQLSAQKAHTVAGRYNIVTNFDTFKEVETNNIGTFEYVDDHMLGVIESVETFTKQKIEEHPGLVVWFKNIADAAGEVFEESKFGAIPFPLNKFAQKAEDTIGSVFERPEKLQEEFDSDLASARASIKDMSPELFNKKYGDWTMRKWVKHVFQGKKPTQEEKRQAEKLYLEKMRELSREEN